MLLNEIINAPSSEMRWTDALQAMVDKHGLHKFTGNQATVITSPDRKAVYRVWARDPGYEKWLAVAETMQDNQHIVKILGRLRTIPTRFKGLPKDVQLKFAKLEKLEPLADGPLHDMVSVADDILKNWSVSEREEHDVESFIETMAAQAETLTDDPEEGAKLKRIAEQHKSFLKTQLELSLKGYNDFHAENVMLRGTTLVITDPAG